MGKSSTGKDTIFKRLLEDKRIKYSTIVPYTTRPIRGGEKNGVEYFFVDEEKLKAIEKSGNLIELRSYNTFYGIWKYFTVNDKQINLDKQNYLMIGTIESYVKTKEFFGTGKVIPVLIDLDDGVRLQRALDREKKQDHPKYQEMCRRYLADAIDFSQEKIVEAGIKDIFYNNNLRECLNEITAYIEKNINA